MICVPGGDMDGRFGARVWFGIMGFELSVFWDLVCTFRQVEGAGIH